MVSIMVMGLAIQGAKSIVVALDRQKLFAFEGNRAVYTLDCISGKANNPTPTGRFAIARKDENHVSREHDVPMPYSLFFIDARGIAIHQTRWARTRSYINYLGIHDMGSYGCVGLSDDGDAKKIFDWAPVGTAVTVLAHDWGGGWNASVGSASTTFGGGRYWTYEMTMSNVHLRIGATSDLRVVDAALGGHYSERVINPARPGGIPANDYAFAFDQGGSQISGTNVTLRFHSTGSNLPRCSAIFNGSVHDDGKLVGSVNFRRTDSSGSINWSVNVPLTLSK